MWNVLIFFRGGYSLLNMQSYLNLLNEILEKGADRPDRTGTGARSLFGCQLRFDLSKSFPLVTTKRVHLKSVIHELLWFLSGDTNIRYLQENGVRIWNEWADEEGNLGPVYGSQWRKWKSPQGKEIDQISDLVENLKNFPESRRHLVVAFNPGELDQMALPPCHAFFQFYSAQEKLSCQLYQRSADMFLGVPFNIASYSLLTMMLAQVCDLKLGEFIISFGDVHIYHNHFEQVKTQLNRNPYPLPKMKIKPEKSLFDYKYENFELLDYQYHPSIKAPVAI